MRHKPSPYLQNSSPPLIPNSRYKHYTSPYSTFVQQRQLRPIPRSLPPMSLYPPRHCSAPSSDGLRKSAPGSGHRTNHMQQKQLSTHQQQLVSAYAAAAVSDTSSLHNQQRRATHSPPKQSPASNPSHQPPPPWNSSPAAPPNLHSVYGTHLAKDAGAAANPTPPAQQRPFNTVGVYKRLLLLEEALAKVAPGSITVEGGGSTYRQDSSPGDMGEVRIGGQSALLREECGLRLLVRKMAMCVCLRVRGIEYENTLALDALPP